jgi:hypothetical protein
MEYKYKQKLPEAVEKDLDTYIERVKNVKWFKPDPSLTKSTIDKKVNAALLAFGVTASIEYRSLETEADYSAAQDAARGAARGAAWGAAWDAARGAAWDAARGAAWDAARGIAWGAADVLVTHTSTYNKNAPFVKMFELWELGVYPVGVVNGAFIVYSPMDFAEKEDALHVVINGVTYIPKV